MNIINEHLIGKTNNISSKEDLFKYIVDLVKKQKGLTGNPNLLLKNIINREKEGSTAFENGLIMPHCRSKYINQITLVVVDFNDCDFKSIDGAKSNFAVAILVPNAQEKKHLEILSKLSKLFSDKSSLLSFKKMTPKEKVSRIKEIITLKDGDTKDQGEAKKGYDFVAITSCAAGIAHTYMARDGLIKGAKELGLTCKIETRGAMTENKLSVHDIDGADFVILATDVKISQKPFLGKKLYVTDTNSAIRNSKEVIQQAQHAKVEYGKGQKSGALRFGGTDKKKEKLLIKSLMSALSFMIPIAIAGGILMAIPNAIAAGGNAKGGTWHFPGGPHGFLSAWWDFAHLGLILMVPILSMFLAYKIGGKPAMPAALLGGYFINDAGLMGKYSIITLPTDLSTQVSAGFLGGLAVGLLVGYMVRYSRWIKWNRFIKPISGLMIIPILSTFLTFLIVVYVIGSPMTYVMYWLYKGLHSINQAGIWADMGVGILFAVLMAIDLGGPINKTALTVATVIFTSTLPLGPDNTNFVPQTAVQSAISVPPLGMWFATMMFRKKFSLTEKAAGTAALPMGLVGITEGALPFAFQTPLKAIAANVTGAAVAGAGVSLLGIHFYGGLGSPLGAWIGYVTNNWIGLAWFLVVIFAGFITGLMYGILRKKVPEYEAAWNEQKLLKKEELAKIGVKTRKQVFVYHFNNFKKSFAVKIKIMINPKNWFEKPSDWNEDDDLEG